MKKLLNLIFFVFVVFIFTNKLFASEDKIKVGLLLPLDGQNQNIGKSVLRAVSLAINKIDDPILEVYPKNNFDNPQDNIKAAQELYDKGVRIFIGSENKLFSLSGSSIIVAPYQNEKQQVVGVLGVIGPTRMNYGRIIPMVNYTAEMMKKILG